MLNTTDTGKDLIKDIDAIGAIPIIPTVLEVICKTTGMGFAAVARVTETRWVACSVKDDIAFGLKPGDELELKSTICNEIRQHHQPVVIDNVDTDEQYATHHTALRYGFKSYISIPIFRQDGSFFGTLCSIDPKPALLNTTETRGMFKLFADLISFHLHHLESLDNAREQLRQQQETARLRDQFIAILGHDLKNPLNAMMMGTSFLAEQPLDEMQQHIVKTMNNSTHRMSGLINNVLDFARGNVGAGISIDSKDINDMQELLKDVIAELQTAWPGKVITPEFDLATPVYCDGNRIAQLASNLIANAIIHGCSDSTVVVKAISNGDFSLSVSNEGKPIPEADIDKLFQPFYRGDDLTGKSGLGLGLYISNEIAKAHRGKLLVQSGDSKTTFTLLLPAK